MRQVNEQASRYPETKWIHPLSAASSGIERREGKERNAAVTMAPTVAVVAAALGAIAVEEVSAEAAVVASGVVVVDARGRWVVLWQRRSARAAPRVVSEK